MTSRAAVVEEVGRNIIGPEAFRGRCIAAISTPLDASGGLNREGLGRLIESGVGSRAAGVAVGTLLGRGARLSLELRAELLSAWRPGLERGRWPIALAGAPPDLRRPANGSRAALAMARQARDPGVDALVVDCPGAVWRRPDRDRLILKYHFEVAEAGLPMLLAYRRKVSGGIACGPEVLAKLHARPEELGIETSTIDDIAAFGHVEALVRTLDPRSWSTRARNGSSVTV